MLLPREKGEGQALRAVGDVWDALIVGFDGWLGLMTKGGLLLSW